MNARTLPIDPLRFRIFSELNIHLGHHGIEKEAMNEISKNLAFLARYYYDTPHPDPLRVSVLVHALPFLGVDDQPTYLHRMMLVVQENPAPSKSVAPPAFPIRSAYKVERVDKKGTDDVTSANKEPGFSPRFRVLIETSGVLGHRRCLIAKFGAIAERVVAGLLSGDESLIKAVDGGARSGKGKEEKAQFGPVWDVQ